MSAGGRGRARERAGAPEDAGAGTGPEGASPAGLSGGVPYSSTRDAIPRSRKKPHRSVKVWTKTEDAIEGSTPRRSSTVGMKAPANPATT